MFDRIGDWTTKQYPKESRHTKRLWVASWRRSKVITVGALVVLIIPSLCGGVFLGKFLGTTNNYITNNIPTTPQPNLVTPETTKSESIAMLSDLDIIAYTVRFAADLRIFESNISIARQKISLSNISGNIGSDEWKAQWSRRNTMTSELDNREATEFRNVYLQPAITLYDEISKRLQRRGIFLRRQKEVGLVQVPILAFDGILVGPTPIADMADFLEMSVRKLEK